MSEYSGVSAVEEAGRRYADLEARQLEADLDAIYNLPDGESDY
jgi:hypothetical protein